MPNQFAAAQGLCNAQQETDILLDAIRSAARQVYLSGRSGRDRHRIGGNVRKTSHSLASD